MKLLLPEKVYDILKWIAMVALPALAVFYSALAPIWGLPYVKEVIGTIAALDTCLGILLDISNATYNFEGDPKYRLMESVKDANWILSEKVYKVLLTVVQIVLPGIAVAYYVLGQFSGFPQVESVILTIIALDTALGMLIGFSSEQFYKKMNFVLPSTRIK